MMHATPWSEELWSRMAPTYTAVLEHPFLHGLADGSLPPDTFEGYLVQDAHYLHDYARALAALGSRADRPEGAAMFARHAAGTVDVELALHDRLLGEVDERTRREPPSPTTVGYTGHLLATVLGGSYAAGVAAVLPCYWIYARVGEHLRERGSSDPRYRAWIDTYAGETFGAVVAEVLAETDRVGAGLTPGQREEAGAAAVRSASYEWLFWDAAHRAETWPTEVAG